MKYKDTVCPPPSPPKKVIQLDRQKHKQNYAWTIGKTYCTVDPKYFEYQFLATLDKRGQGIPNDGDKRGGRKG